MGQKSPLVADPLLLCVCYCISWEKNEAFRDREKGGSGRIQLRCILQGQFDIGMKRLSSPSEKAPSPPRAPVDPAMQF